MTQVYHTTKTIKSHKRFCFLLLLLASVLLAGPVLSQSSVVFDTPGASSFIVPCGVTEITVEVWGGGGSGGRTTGNNQYGGGGGAGGFSTAVFVVVEGDVIPFVVGSGGQSNVNLGNGVGNGLDSQISGITANGGSGAGLTTGGAGGSSSGGTTNLTGANGYNATIGSGSNPSNSGAGANGVSGATGGAALTSSGAGNSGNSPGAGGGGAYGAGGNTFEGGSGGNGQITISWDPPFPAGSGQALSECATTATLNAPVVPAGYIGTWTVSPAGPSVTDPNDPASGVTNFALNEEYTFTWTVTSDPAGECVAITDEVIVATQSMPVNAGFNQTFCASNFVMAANDPAPYTGTWSIISGSANIVDPSSPTTQVTGLAVGACVELQWELDDLSGCVGTDNVILCQPAANESCNDDPCAATPIPLNGCEAGDFAGSTVTQNPGQPGCGSYDYYGGDHIDVWYTAETDANGNLNLELTGTTYLNAAIYTGTCNNLSQFSCHGLNNTSPFYIQETNLPPNSTVYIRVWRRIDSPAATFTICQTVSTNDSQVQPGVTNIACGSSYTFYDSGGSTGNYGNNELTVWTICPDDPDMFVTVNFSSVNLEAGFDQLTIIDGDDASDPVLAVTATATTYTSSHESGCLTFIFRSDLSIAYAGWAATVSCTSTEVTNTYPNVCNEQNCLGGCMRTLCGTGAVPFQGNGYGIQELTYNNNGCMDTGERCSNWFFINPQSPGNLTMDMYVNNGQNQDFVLYEGYAPSLACPSFTGDQPIMCNIAPATNLGTGFNSNYSGFNNAYEDDLIITQQQIEDEVYYILQVQTFSNGAACPQPNVTITFGGSAILSCEDPVNPPSTLDIDLLEFNGVHKDNRNYLYWSTSSERNNAYFTLDHSIDGYNWTSINHQNGAGNSVSLLSYHFDHYTYERAINYYRLSQTDFDGTREKFPVIAIDNRTDRVLLRTLNLIGQEVNENYRGIVIYHYSDGSYEKIYK